MSKTALVVHPNPSTQRRAESALASMGFDVILAHGVREARMRTEGGSVDLALSGVRLPDGSGYELARTLRDEHPAALVYLVAGGFEVYDPEQASECGVDGRISSPFTAASLRQVVESALGPMAFQEEDAEDPQSYKGPIVVESGLEPLPARAVSPLSAPPESSERLASFIPRDPRAPEPVAVDPAVVGPALERAILEVLPEVVEAVLRSSLSADPDFRGLVEKAVQDAVAARMDSSQQS